MYNAELFLGETGLDKTFQRNHPPSVVCQCGKKARIIFVVAEDGVFGERPQSQKFPKIVCDLAKDDDKMWPHDCCSFAVYMCPNCLKATTTWNQA